MDIPGGPGVKNPLANAGYVGLILGPGGSCIPCGNHACVTQLLSPHVHNETPAHHNWRRSPRWLQLEKVARSNEDPVKPKKKKSKDMETIIIQKRKCKTKITLSLSSLPKKKLETHEQFTIRKFILLHNLTCKITSKSSDSSLC